MIKLIGLRRALLLGVFLTLNALAAAAYLLWIMPMHDDADMALRNLNAQIGQMTMDIQNIHQEMRAFKTEYPKYQDLEKKGFFLQQDRFLVQRALDDLRFKSGLVSFAYTVDAIQALKSADADKAQRSLINSRVKVERISSLIDTNFFDFMMALSGSFPQHTRVQKFSLHRTQDVNDETLNRVAANNVTFVESEIVFDWYTMVQKQAPEAAGGTGSGFRGR